MRFDIRVAVFLCTLLMVGCGGGGHSSGPIPAAAPLGKIRGSGGTVTPAPTPTPPATIARLSNIATLLRADGPTTRGSAVKLRTMTFTEGSDSSIDVCPSFCVIPGQTLNVGPLMQQESQQGTMTIYFDNANSGLSITASPAPSVSGPPYNFTIHFAPTTSVATNLYPYDYYFVFQPTSGTGGYTTSKLQTSIITACSLALNTCPQVQIVDKNVGNVVVAASPAPSPLPTTTVGLNQVPTVQWKSGTGKPGVTYTFSSSNSPEFYLAGSPVSQYGIDSAHGSATPPPGVPYPINTAAPSYYYFTEGGNAGPYTDTTMTVANISLQGVISSSYTEMTAQPAIAGGYRVITPTNVQLSATYGSVQVNKNTDNTQSLGFGWIDDVGALHTPGITFNFNATVANPTLASFATIQLGDNCVIQTDADGGQYFFGQSTQELDSPSSTTPFFGAKTSQANAAWTGSDGPSTTIRYMNAAYTSIYAQNHFTDYFMYQPAPLQSGQKAIWVPIGKFTWYWNGTATGAAPNPFTKSGGQGGVLYAPQTTPPGDPVWSAVLQSNGNAQQSSKMSNC